MTHFISANDLDGIAGQLQEIERLTRDRVKLLEGLVVSMAVGLSVDEMPEAEAELLREILDEGGDT